MKSEKGVTIIVLVLTIVVLVIITSILVYNSFDSLEVARLTKLNTDIKALSDRVASYYVKNNELPTFGSPIQKSQVSAVINDLNSNDGDTYYALDLSKIDNPTLNFGQGYTVPNQDMYIINEETHNIYYLKGVTYDGVQYHTTGEY